MVPAEVQAVIDKSGATNFAPLLQHITEIAYSTMYGTTTNASKRFRLAELAIARANQIPCLEFL